LLFFFVFLFIWYIHMYVCCCCYLLFVVIAIAVAIVAVVVNRHCIFSHDGFHVYFFVSPLDDTTDSASLENFKTTLLALDSDFMP